MGPFPYAPDEADVAPVGDALKNLLRAGSMPFALGARGGAGVNDFLSNLTASMMGMKRPDPSAASTASSRSFLDPSFKAAGEIAGSFNPMPMLREAARGSGWQDEEPETPTPRSSTRDIGVGGPAASRSLPRLGTRSPVVIDNQTGSVDSSAQGFGEESPNPGAFPTASQVPAESDDLGDRYRKRVAGIPAPKGDLTPEQRQKLQMDFFMQMLANNAPGSRFLQNAGQAGVSTSAASQAQTEKNLARSTQQQQFARDEVFKEMGLSDKSQDNKERARHQKAIEDLQRQANEINKQYREGQIDAKAAELEVRKIQAQMAELRASANPLKAQTEYIRSLAPNMPPMDALRMALSRGKSDEDTQIDDLLKVERGAAARSGMPGPSRDQVKAGMLYGGKISSSHPDYIQALKDPAIGGDKKKLDAILQTRGLRVVD